MKKYIPLAFACLFSLGTIGCGPDMGTELVGDENEFATEAEMQAEKDMYEQMRQGMAAEQESREG